MSQWNELAAAVRRRRLQLGLTQEEMGRTGGPSHQTIRNVEQAARTAYSNRTYALIENVLTWKPGTVDAILAGTADPDPEEWLRAPTPTPVRTSPLPPAAVLDFVRAERDQLIVQRAAVLAIHSRADHAAVCQSCVDPDEEPTPWPCPTARALGVTP